MILRILLIVATPYVYLTQVEHPCEVAQYPEEREIEPPHRDV